MGRSINVAMQKRSAMPSVAHAGYSVVLPDIAMRVGFMAGLWCCQPDFIHHRWRQRLD
jgi:hypothetical protein